MHLYFLRSLCVLLSLSFFLVLLPVSQPAYGDMTDRVQVQVGQPSIWSLGQAHYLLQQLRRDNKGLKLNILNPGDLDPNKPNSLKIQILKTLLDLQVSYSQGAGVLNNQVLRNREVSNSRSVQANMELKQKQKDLDAVNLEIPRLQEEVAVLEARRNGRDPNAPRNPSEDEELARLKARLASKKEEQVRLKDEVAELKRDSAANPSDFRDPQFDSSKGDSLPDPEALKKILDKVLNDPSYKPSVAASVALDNFVSMEYEILSKQLTMLRDEAGPNERIIFLELPASIYTADGRADNLVAQVEWEIDGAPFEVETNGQPKKGQTNNRSQQDQASNQYREMQENSQVQEEKSKVFRIIQFQRFPSVSPLKDKPEQPEDSKFKKCGIRAVELIPKQSALNINEFNGVSKKGIFSASLLFLFGIGLKTNYQRQRESYDQFLQQDIFASAYGKGLNKFGWIFGPQPGKKRITPGQKTMYAVLAVPRELTHLRVKSNAFAFNKKDTHKDDDASKKAKTNADESFIISIPSEATSLPEIDRISYSPTKGGDPVVVSIKGHNFSPQIGLLINGIALNNPLSIASNLFSSAPEEKDSKGIKGNFEILNSEEIILNFKMPIDFKGNPEITVVSPEGSIETENRPSVIDFWGIKRSLRDMARLSPMFRDSFAVNPNIQVLDEESKDFLLTGNGFDQDSYVGINDLKNKNYQNIPSLYQLVLQDSDLKSFFKKDDGSYNSFGDIIENLQKQNKLKLFLNLLTIKDNCWFLQTTTGLIILHIPLKEYKDGFQIRYGQRTSGRFELGEAKYQLPPQKPCPSYEILRYNPDLGNNQTELVIRVDTSIQRMPKVVNFPNATVEYLAEGTDRTRITIRYPKQELIQLDTLTLDLDPKAMESETSVNLPESSKTDGVFQFSSKIKWVPTSNAPWLIIKPGQKGTGSGKVEYEVQENPGTARTGTFTVAGKIVTINQAGKKCALLDIRIPVLPTLTLVANKRNGLANGSDVEESKVRITGSNLDKVTRVLFGNLEAAVQPGMRRFDSLFVTVPALPAFEEGKTKTVPVYVMTGQGEISNVLEFTYLGTKPKPAGATKPGNGVSGDGGQRVDVTVNQTSAPPPK